MGDNPRYARERRLGGERQPLSLLRVRSRLALRARGDRAVIVDDNQAITSPSTAAPPTAAGLIELPPLVAARLAMR